MGTRSFTPRRVLRRLFMGDDRFCLVTGAVRRYDSTLLSPRKIAEVFPGVVEIFRGQAPFEFGRIGQSRARDRNLEYIPAPETNF